MTPVDIELKLKVEQALAHQSLQFVRNVRGDYLRLYFGKGALMITKDSKKTNSCEHILFVCRPFRMIKQGKILWGDADMFHPKSDVDYEEWRKDLSGKSVLDDKLEAFVKNECPLHVSSISVGEIGSMEICFVNNMIFEIMAHSGADLRLWELRSRRE